MRAFDGNWRDHATGNGVPSRQLGYVAALLFFAAARFGANAVPLAAQSDSAQSDSAARTPRFTLSAGLGNSFGGVGGNGEVYLFGGRVGLVAGLGFVVQAGFGGTETSTTIAGAVRGNSSNRPSRWLLEVAGGKYLGEDTHYGPALLVGRQWIRPSGLTWLLDAGAGLGVDDAWHPALNIGIGYTWR